MMLDNNHETKLFWSILEVIGFPSLSTWVSKSPVCSELC